MLFLFKQQLMTVSFDALVGLFLRPSPQTAPFPAVITASRITSPALSTISLTTGLFQNPLSGTTQALKVQTIFPRCWEKLREVIAEIEH